MAENTRIIGRNRQLRIASATWGIAGVVLCAFMGTVNATEKGLNQERGQGTIALLANEERWIMTNDNNGEEKVETAASGADDGSERMELARKLIKILGYERNYEKRVDRAMALTYQDMKQKYVRNPKMLPVLRDVLAEVRQDMLKRKQEYFELMAREYAKGMDKDVMAAAIEFYSSPLGQAFIKQNKMVRRRAKAASKVWVKSMMKKAIQDVFRKARERGVPL